MRRAQVIEVDMRPEQTSYRLLQGSGILIEHFGEQPRLDPVRPQVRAPIAEGEGHERSHARA
jgi:hypothetical protein